MKRRKIDTRTISPRRPTLSRTESVTAYMFASALERFANEYLRAAMTVSTTGMSSGIVFMSLEDTAYMLRLMVEYGGETSVLETHITMDEHLTIDTYFPNGLPDIESLSMIARAARTAGFFFEVRGERIICRATITECGRVPIYAGNFDIIFECLGDMFFSKY